MQNTGQAGAKKSYRVVLLLVVGLAACANAFKELNQLRDLTMQTTQYVAQLQDAFVPAGDLIRVETCQNRRMIPPPLPEVAPVPPAPAVQSDAVQVEVPEVAPVAPVTPVTPVAPAVRSVVAPAAPKVREVPPVRPARPARSAAEVRVFAPNVDFEKTIKDAFESDLSLKALKAKNRRYIYVSPEGHDVILKTFNRSINLRSAS